MTSLQPSPTPREERLHPGEFFGSGTLPAGCALEERRTPRTTAEPVRVETFRDYAEWFRQWKQIYPQRAAG